MKRRIFLVCLFYCFLDGRSTNLLRLFSGNLRAMFLSGKSIGLVIIDTKPKNYNITPNTVEAQNVK